MLFSIVRTVAPGTPCSHPAGRTEVYFLAPYNVCQHSRDNGREITLQAYGRDEQETRRQAHEMAQTFQNCCYLDGITYTVEELTADDSPERAPAA